MTLDKEKTWEELNDEEKERVRELCEEWCKQSPYLEMERDVRVTEDGSVFLDGDENFCNDLDGGEIDWLLFERNRQAKMENNLKEILTKVEEMLSEEEWEEFKGELVWTQTEMAKIRIFRKQIETKTEEKKNGRGRKGR